MADKKSSKPDKSPQEEALEEKVDDMMSVEKKSSTDVSKLAEDVNKQILSSEAEPEPETEPVDKPIKATTEPSDELDDNVIDKAVDDIVAKEGDTVLAVEDAKQKRSAGPSKPSDWKSRLKAFFKDKRTWAGLAVILIIIFAVPFTRYKVLGLVVKKSVTVTVVDSKTSAPVSNAEVQLAGDTAKTDEEGHAKLSSGVGPRKLSITKKYYTNYQGNYFVGFSTKTGQASKLVATGRLVPITVINKITGKPIAGAQIEVKGTTAKTNNKGQADVGLPVKDRTYKGVIKLSGYNDTSITVQVTDKAVKQNNFGLTPSGHLYFLSNLNGTLDVVKSNLDGTDRKVVLEGTGSEQPSDTNLLASRDWRYLVLKSRRDTKQAALYLIDTTNDKVTSFDNGDASFSLIGWYGHSFIYSLSRNNLQIWQPDREILKSYDADHQQLNQLDQSQADGTQDNYASQGFSNFYILNGVVSYTTTWNGYADKTTGKNNTIRAVQPNGQNKKDYQTFPSSTSYIQQAALYEPQAVYYAVSDNTSNKTNYYEFENLAVKPATVDQSALDQGYPTFLLSPSGNKTFWTELRDGKNALFTGGPNADGKKQIASLSDYSPYGWYSDNYVLVSKKSSELYIMSPTASTEPPLKITDYYKPAQTYRGYGYGYGGL